MRFLGSLQELIKKSISGINDTSLFIISSREEKTNLFFYIIHPQAYQGVSLRTVYKAKEFQEAY